MAALLRVLLALLAVVVVVVIGAVGHDQDIHQSVYWTVNKVEEGSGSGGGNDVASGIVFKLLENRQPDGDNSIDDDSVNDNVDNNNIGDDNAEVGAVFVREQDLLDAKTLIKLHGAFMVVAWMGTTVIGVLIARYIIWKA